MPGRITGQVLVDTGNVPGVLDDPWTAGMLELGFDLMFAFARRGDRRKSRRRHLPTTYTIVAENDARTIARVMAEGHGHA